MNQALAHDRGTFEFVPLVHRVFASRADFELVVIVTALLSRVPRALALDAFAVFSGSSLLLA